VQKVRSNVKRLTHDAHNPHSDYTYVSIDAYYERVIPIACDCGLVWRTREVNWDFVEGMGRGKDRTYVKARFQFDLFADGAAALDYMTITVISPLEGAQTSGQLFSYADKVFMRVAFGIATGEKDADHNATEATVSFRPTGIPSSPTGVKDFEKGDVPPGVDPITGEVLLDPPPVIAAEALDIAKPSKTGDPIVDTRKINEASAKLVVDIFKTWMPKVKNAGQLLDWHAENVAAIEIVGKIDPVYKETIKGMFNERNAQLKIKEKK